MSEKHSESVDLKLGLLSAALVQQNESVIHSTILDLREGGTERNVVHEIILQSYLHDGYATALEGVATLQQLWPTKPNEEIETYAQWSEWQKRGRELFGQIYGDVAQKVEETVHTNSPELALWMLHEGYGKVLARPGVDVRTREMCTVAVLVMKSRPKQLFSHLRGAIRVGVTRDQIVELFAEIRTQLSADQLIDKALLAVDRLSS